MKIKAVIYDVDGTLINSEPLHVAAWDEALKQNNHKLADLSDDFIKSMAGKKPIVIATEITQALRINIEPLALLEAKTRIYLSLADQKLEEMVGATSSISRLRNKGYRLAIGTSLDRKLLSVILSQLNIVDDFEVIVTGDQITKGKPDPETYATVARLLNLKPQQCVVIEDAQSGVAAAKSAGVWCIAVKNPEAIQQDLTAADRIVESLDDVTGELIESLPSQ
jgi:HAD superfamily hydrolase (TIGR01509 family)